MTITYMTRGCKRFTKSALIASAILLFFVSGLPVVSAQQTEGTAGKATPVVKVPVAQGPLRQVNPYFSTQTITYGDGTIVQRQIINGPPKPPPGYEDERKAVAPPEPDQATATNILTVPAYKWVFGCSATAAAMIAGYYDRLGYENIYTGPTDHGVMPMYNNTNYWPEWSDEKGVTYPNLPLAASHNGVDGRTACGSIDDYWIYYYGGSGVIDDPYITNDWPQHAWGDAIGDYMKTSQSGYGNPDGATTFHMEYGLNWKITCDEMENTSSGDHLLYWNDGTYGRKLFYEKRGYTVTDCYTQVVNTEFVDRPESFNFSDYIAEIDAGRPVMILLFDIYETGMGHTIVGVGYSYSYPSFNRTVYFHDSWDDQLHSMDWDGNYLGVSLQHVSIVNLAPLPAVCTFAISPESATVSGSNGTGSVSVTASDGSCFRTAASHASWITVTSGSSGTGNGTVGYSYKANNTGKTREGTISIAGKTFTLTQKKRSPINAIYELLLD